MGENTTQQALQYKRIIFSITLAFLIVILASIYFQYVPKQLPQFIPTEATPTVIAPVTPSPLTTETPNATVATKTTPSTPPNQGSDLREIKYTLPEGWKAEFSTDRQGKEGVMITPSGGGGYFYLQVHSYLGQSGRRDYYCKTFELCLPGSTFTPTQLGNISGYSATGLDNSGGGTEYFGAKGDKFYRISSFSPSSPTETEFDKSRKKFLDSLVF